MTDAPSSGLITRFLLENPWPLGCALLLVGLVVGGLGLRDGRADRIRFAFVPVLLGAAIIGTGLLVVTPGERARRVVLSFVEAIVAGDVIAADARLADDAVAHLGSARNPGHDRAYIVNGLDRLADRYRIESNRVSRLDAATVSSTEGSVFLACWTEIGSYGPIPSQWQVEAAAQADGTWKITRLTCISVSERTPPSSW